jgi:DNA-binding Lrp family transcriptional regulator
MKDNGGYYVQFPLILLDHVNMRQAVLFGIITSMTNKHGYCYAHNETLAEIVKTHLTTLKNDLQRLEKLGAIRREVVRNEKKEIIKRKIFIQHTFLDKINGTPSVVKSDLPLVANHDLPSVVNHDLGGAQITTIDIDKDIEINNTISDKAFFEKVFDEYQRKGSGFAAYLEWKELTPEEKEAVRLHVRAWVKNHFDNDKMIFLPHFQNYLSKKRWLDELLYENTEPQPIISKNVATLNDD